MTRDIEKELLIENIVLARKRVRVGWRITGGSYHDSAYTWAATRTSAGNAEEITII